MGDFVFDSRTGKLTGADAEVRLEPQVGEFLHLLVRRAGSTVSRESISEEIWPDRVVGDDALRVMVKKLREALGDNARNPTYIKTLPMKGYVLIAAVRPLPSPRRCRSISPALAGGTLAALLATIGVLLGSVSLSRDPPIARIEALTSMPGSELSPDYSAATDRLLFSHRANKDDYLQLYAKRLSTQRVQRLTWDDANYANAFWSPTGTQLIYTRSTDADTRHFRAGFDPEQGIVDPQPLPAVAVQGKFLLGWSADSRSVYLKDAFAPERPQGIWRLELASGNLAQVTAPSVRGIGDFFARESADGRMLALLRGVDDGKRELLVVDIPTGSLLHTRVLSGHPDRLAWSADGRSLALSSFAGELLQYHLAEDRFAARDNPSSHINDVFFQCGDDCYFLRRHNGNFLDLQEQPDPFDTRPLMSSDHFDLPGAEDFPLYDPTGEILYFASRGDGELLLQRRSRKSGTATIARFAGAAQIRSLAINAGGSHIAGLVDKRIFVLDIASGALRFLTRDIDSAGPPTWTTDGQAILFAEREKGVATLYRHAVSGDRRSAVISGYSAARQIDETRLLAVDGRQRAWLIDGGEVVRQVAALPSIMPNRWQIRGKWLYYTGHVGNNAYMTRVDLETGTEEQRLLARNRFRLNFDMHPHAARIVTVKSMLAESDLIRLALAGD